MPNPYHDEQGKFTQSFNDSGNVAQNFKLTPENIPPQAMGTASPPPAPGRRKQAR